MEHFKPNKDYAPSLLKVLSMAFLTVFTLGIPFFFMYEMWAEPAYWKNRWKLHRLLNRGKVKVKYARSTSIYGDQIKAYDLDIEGVEYSLWIWNEKNMTLDKSILANNDFIGLFTGSLTTKWLNRIAVKKILQLAEHSAYEEYEEMSTNCSIKQI
jgi:hypothetical protein